MSNYEIRKWYVRLHPLLGGTECHADCVQYIMRDTPLFQDRIPFFLEPWVQPGETWVYRSKEFGLLHFELIVIKRFTVEFFRWLKATIKYGWN